MVRECHLLRQLCAVNVPIPASDMLQLTTSVAASLSDCDVAYAYCALIATAAPAPSFATVFSDAPTVAMIRTVVEQCAAMHPDVELVKAAADGALRQLMTLPRL